MKPVLKLSLICLIAMTVMYLIGGKNRNKIHFLLPARTSMFWDF